MRATVSDRLMGPLGALLTGTLVAILLGVVAARMGALFAVMGLTAIGLAAFVGARSLNTLLAAIAISALLPYWYGRGGVTVAHLAQGLALLWIITAKTVRRTRLRWSGVDYAVVAVLVAAFLDWWLRGGNFAAARASADTFEPLIFYFAARLVPLREIRHVLWVIIAATAIASLSLFYEFAQGATVFQDPNAYYWAGNGIDKIFRPGGVFGAPPTAVTILAMVSLVAIPLLRETTGRWRKLLSAGIALMVAGGIITFTRAGWIGFGAGLLTYFFVLRWRARIPLPRWLSVVPVAAVAVVLALPTLSRTNWFQLGVQRQGTFAVRESYWTLAGKLITDAPNHLLLGRGINSLVAGARPEVGGLEASVAANPLLITMGAHNQYVRTLLEQGLVGLTLILLWLGGTIALAIRRMPALDLLDRRLLAGLAAATTSFLVVSTADTNLRDTVSFSVIALLTGLAVTLCSSRPAAVT